MDISSSDGQTQHFDYIFINRGVFFIGYWTGQFGPLKIHNDRYVPIDNGLLPISVHYACLFCLF